MKIFRSSLVALTAWALLWADAFGLPYSELIVFGDSLSDVGNVNQSTLGVTPVSAYYNGRFSNGPVYSEQLANLLGLAPLVHSRSGGTNYAHGNAQTSGNADLFVLDVESQVTEYIDNRTPNTDSLFVVFAGANDFLDGQTNVNIPVNNLVSDIERLINDGAKNFLLANLPLLGLTPRFNTDPGQASSMNTLSLNFNSALASAIDSLEALNPSIDFFRLDVAGLINSAVGDPTAFGLVNATESAAPGLTPFSFFYNTNQIVSEPDKYLFWDDVHPTTAAHTFLAQSAFDAVTYSADFDFDGKVDALDLAEWESSYNFDAQADANGDGASNGLDFLQWQLQFGQGVAPISPIAAVVPEPGSILITISLFAWGLVGSTRRWH